ncbi:hypothetical protein ACIOJD_07560 [Streptomyces sp. NPDC088116]|uniref:hypothetical protein n=1 Tax=Streptomyces sp. NPDC088116 TaxID=3365825 RepID=UPI003827EDB6
MDNEGGGADVSSQQDGVARLLGALLIELGHKVQQAGVDGVHILSDEEVERDRLRWYRTGWDEHAHAADPHRAGAVGHPDTEHLPVPPGRLIRFPDPPPDGTPPAPRTPPRPPSSTTPAPSRSASPSPSPSPSPPPSPSAPSATSSQPLPIVGAGEANVRDLMPHRPRHRTRPARERGDER